MAKGCCGGENNTKKTAGSVHTIRRGKSPATTPPTPPTHPPNHVRAHARVILWRRSRERTAEAERGPFPEALLGRDAYHKAQEAVAVRQVQREHVFGQRHQLLLIVAVPRQRRGGAAARLLQRVLRPRHVCTSSGISIGGAHDRAGGSRCRGVRTRAAAASDSCGRTFADLHCNMRRLAHAGQGRLLIGARADGPPLLAVAGFCKQAVRRLGGRTRLSLSAFL